MRKTALTLSLASSILAGVAVPHAVDAQNTAPVVSNVVAEQLSGTGLVRVRYDIADAEGDSLTITMVFSSDGGTTFDLVPNTISGDVNHRVAPGTGREIIWDAGADYPGRYWASVVARVTANDGRTLGGEMVYVPAGAFARGSPY